MAKKRKDNKGRVLKAGEMQRKQDGRYAYEYKDMSGARKRVYALTLAELREKEDQIQRDLLDGIDTQKGDMTLNRLFEIYLSNKTDIRDTTRCNYVAMWENHVSDTTLGKMKISRIKQMHIKAFYTSLADKGLAAGTIRNCHELIFPALEMAVDSDIIRKNPAKGAQKGIGNIKKDKVALTRAEQEKLLSFAENSNIYNVYAPFLNFALETGLRIGELAGLRWTDVDTKKNVIHVRQQVIYKNLGEGCKLYIHELKTKAGQRDIPLTGTAKEALKKQREIYRITGKAFIQQEVDGIKDFVFTNSKGTPYTPSGINPILNNMVNAYNKREAKAAKEENRAAELLPHISVHTLRHTACTRFVEMGLEPKVLQMIMGHSSIAVTMDVYTHLNIDEIQEKLDAAQAKIG